MERKQTAVQWLIDNMPEDFRLSLPFEFVEQDLQMGREQIQDSYWEGAYDAVQYNRTDIDTSNITLFASEYYTKTFKNTDATD